MKNDKSIYVIFFSTPFKIGAVIRKFTKNKYNHSAISLDSDFSKVYSFARYNKNNPLYGGFVHESLLRYNNKGMTAEIKICQIPIAEEDYNDLLNYIKKLSASKKEYIYNLYSALTYVFEKKVQIKKSYTCVEFVLKILSKYCQNLKIDKDKFYSILDLENILKKYIIYEGKIDDILIKATWEDDLFLTKRNIFIRTGYLLNNNARLTYRLIKKKIPRGEKNGKN